MTTLDDLTAALVNSPFPAVELTQHESTTAGHFARLQFTWQGTEIRRMQAHLREYGIDTTFDVGFTLRVALEDELPADDDGHIYLRCPRCGVVHFIDGVRIRDCRCGCVSPTPRAFGSASS